MNPFLNPEKTHLKRYKPNSSPQIPSTNSPKVLKKISIISLISLKNLLLYKQPKEVHSNPRLFWTNRL